MRLRLKKQDPGLMDIDDLSARLEDVEKKNEFLQLSIRALFRFIKDFSLDIKEINSNEFRSDISKLSEKFAELKRLKKIQLRFERDKEFIADYIDLQKKYLGDRESELKDIIEILTNAMVNLDSENQQYNEKNNS